MDKPRLHLDMTPQYDGDAQDTRREADVSWWQRLMVRVGRRGEGKAALPLYAAAVARAREPHWYLAGGVADTLDGRFDMVAAVLAMILLRLEAGTDGAPIAAQLTECFVADMDAQVRQIGFGDMVVGKHIGRMIGMLGGRLGAYREGIVHGGELEAALVRNLYRGNAPDAAALAHTRAALVRLYAELQPIGVAALIAGRLP